MSTPKPVINGGIFEFGGTRLSEGRSTYTLWSDGVVTSSAWSMHEPLIAGDLFEFRGTIARGTGWLSSRRWALREDTRGFIGDYATRKDAVQAAHFYTRMLAFRALREAEERNTVWTIVR